MAQAPLWPHQYILSPADNWLTAPLIDDDLPQVSWSSDNKFIFVALMETDADIVLLDGALQ